MNAEYRSASRDYLQRAQNLLRDDNAPSLFYAAFELRCGVEARMREYLEVAEDISEKRKQGWEVVKLGKDIERAFEVGDKIVQLIFHGAGNTEVCIYHTPVSSKLQKQAKQLGDYMHALKVHRKPEDPWWKSFRLLLEETRRGLAIATTGTLLGPLLLGPDRKTTKMHHELEIDPLADELVLKIGKEKGNVKLQVRYLDALPGNT
jgi:hypothetical protein